LALPDEHLLTEYQDLAVTIAMEQAGEQGSKRRGQRQRQVPEHARRMTRLEGEVNATRRAPGLRVTCGRWEGQHRAEAAMLTTRHVPQQAA
jgi:hypothetical protein